jgi:hypothetical protein
LRRADEGGLGGLPVVRVRIHMVGGPSADWQACGLPARGIRDGDGCPVAVHSEFSPLH